MERIYVQVPAYRDSELAPTLADLFEKAAHPERIRVCVYWQRAEDETLPQAIRDNPNIEIIDVLYHQSNGCNWARRELQRRWKKEEYTLLIDSHHRFIEGWDGQLISMYKGLKRDGSKKPLITAYLPPYDPQNDPAGRQESPLQIHCHSREQGMLIYLEAHPIPLWTWLEKPVKAKYLSLHFVFTTGRFNREILFDDDIYFFGDEVVTGLKAFTHGYDLFHPHYVMGWHLYKREQTRRPHWTDHADYNERHERSHRKMRDIFLGVDESGMGSARTLDDYEYLICDKLIMAGS